MSLAFICILYCKQCNTINESNICWFSQFGFPRLLEGLQLGVSLSLMARTTMEKISDGKEQRWKRTKS
jgi:hypothetical protein